MPKLFLALAFSWLFALEDVLANDNLFKPAAPVGDAVGLGASTGGAISTAGADLNLDGIPELITIASSNSSDPHFRIHTRNTSSTWDSINVRSASHVANQRPNRFGGDSIVYDLNGDLYPDILVPQSPNGPGQAQVSWFENPAVEGLTGIWTEHVIATWDGSNGADKPAHMSEIFAGDMDGDNDVDVVTRDVNNGLHLLVNDGAGTFDRHFLATNPREGLDLFDPDHDGDLDILLNGVWLEAPDAGAAHFADLTDTGNFTQHEIVPEGVNHSPWYPAVNNSVTQKDYASKVLAVDLNHDGLEDVVITNSEELSNSSGEVKPEGIIVYLASSLGGNTWTEIILQSESRKLHTLDAADVDLDGDIDLLSGISRVGLGNEPAEVFVYMNEGEGTQWTKSSIDAVNIYSGIFLDYDNDGDVDIVGPDNWNSGPLNFFESIVASLPPVLPGDYNKDDTVNGLDLAAWESTFGTSVTSDFDGADGDGNQLIDGADLLVWMRQMGQSQVGSTESARAIPEPSTVALLGGALMLLSHPSRLFRSSVIVCPSRLTAVSL